MAKAEDRGAAPPLSALRAVEAAARLGSFTRAAEELGVTQGAISRAVRVVETAAGVALFERTGHGLVPTEPGAAYAARVRGLLRELDAATLDLGRFRRGARPLTLAVLPTFAARWLVPRLPRLLARHPELRLSLVARSEPFAFAEGGPDAAIHYGSEPWPGALSDPLMEVTLVPVAAPALLGGTPPGPAGLASLPLIQHLGQPLAWRAWLDRAGLDHPRPLAGIAFDSYETVIRAAMSGLGVALVRSFMVEEELRDGRLLALDPRRLPAAGAYHFVYPETKRVRPELQALRRWLVAESRRAA